MPQMLGAADVVVSRAGATTLLELAAIGAPTILIPNGQLTGGHQLKNADAYARNGAVRVLDEHDVDTDPHVLARAIIDLLDDESARQEMAKKFHAFAKPNAARDVAEMVRDTAAKQR
jgi:UDP-N-acetylglucosamine--N-acetylmuramyl-(pentapeptide) pyrophosphoryl-undecaprenol N-acetylglucosamine transferase